jgi:RNA polymerase sigma factor (sigma-70 family)
MDATENKPPPLTDEQMALFVENDGLVGFTIKNMKIRKIEYQDQFQIGRMALAKAARSFDASKGYKFSTFAVRAIRNGLIRESRNAGLIRIPCYLQEKGAYERACYKDAKRIRGVARLDGMDEVSDVAPPPAIRDTTAMFAMRMDIEAAIRTLKPCQQDVIRSHYLHGESAISIGIRMHRDRTAVDYAKNAALRNLSNRLQAYA